MEQCIALVDYEAQVPEEISFKKGDVITVVAKGSNSGFWEGMVNNAPKGSKKKERSETVKDALGSDAEASTTEKKGLFPNCFVSSNLRPNTVPSFTDKAMAMYDYVAKDASELPLKRGDVITVVRPGGSPGWWCGYNETAVKRMMGEREDLIKMKCGTKKHPLLFPTNFVSSKVVAASFAFQGRSAHELTLVANDVILVHRRWNDGWWEGSVGNRRGIFPSNYTLPNVATTDPPFFCPRCKTPFVSHGALADCKECGKNEELVASMTAALLDHAKGTLPSLDLFAYVELDPAKGGKSALLSVADTVDRSVRKEKPGILSDP